MKRKSTILLSPLGEETVTNLTTQVKETLATGFKRNNSPVFSTADLWNIQRRGRVRLSRRYF